MAALPPVSIQMNKKLVYELRAWVIVLLAVVIAYATLEKWDAIKAWIVRLFS
ncbi:MAG: hypothetical protein ABSG50_06180 [Opitutaceae bacterium]|jgi:hypothetical protein